MNMRRWLGLCAGFGLGIGTAHATVWYVATNGSDTASGTNWAEAYATIGNALASNAIIAGENHEIWVSNGTYNLSAQLVLTKGVRVWGAYGANQTILDGGDAVRCVFITNGILDGFTVTKGYADSAAENQYGGGVYIVTGQVLNCTVVGNRASYQGGGIYGRAGGVGLVSNCVISQNSTTNAGTYGGGGAYFSGAGWQVRNCPSIDNNMAYRDGGGILLSGGVMDSCTISSNYCGWYGFPTYGAGVAALANSQVTRCLIVANSASSTNESYGAGLYLTSGTLVSHCTVLSNEGAYNGGGIYQYDGWTRQCTISFNRANSSRGPLDRGAGMYARLGEISDCVISKNTSDSQAAGLYVSSTVTAMQCMVIDNLAPDRAAFATDNGTPTLRNCLFTRNVATDSSGSIISFWSNPPGHARMENCTVVSNRGGYGGFYGRGTNTFVNSVIYSNKGSTAARDNIYETSVTGATFWSCCTPTAASLAGADNIPDDPAFKDPAGGDWRLAADSPCVNAGTNAPWVEGAVDLDGHRRADAFSRQVDIGAYEYVPQGALIQLR